jgi:SAM-dependent methyltransferase
VDLGDLARTTPVDGYFGFDRGTPIDRHYIEHFLAERSADIRGRVLEVGDSAYSKRFGSGVTKQDVLHLNAGRGATIVGDIATEGSLPAGAFDCIILVQTLQLIYDLDAAVAELRRALRPGGVVLATFPGISSVDRGEWGGSWCWSLTEHSAKRLFGDAFGADAVEAAAYGNVYAATCFLQGLCVEEIERQWLDRSDDAYPVTITVRAQRK